MPRSSNPLLGPPPTEVPLPSAPLVRVIAQVRFSAILSIDTPEHVAPFQERLRATYPHLQQDQQTHVSVGLHGQPSVAAAPVIWRFSDTARDWRISLSRDFLALESVRYTSRTDLLHRLRDVLSALDDTINPTVFTGLGIRYVDRITGAALETIETLIQPDILGIDAVGLRPQAVHTLSEAAFQLDTTRLACRWGRIPAGATVDPQAIEAINEASWILDLDHTISTEAPFHVDTIIETARGFCERCYAFFRWSVTDEFLRCYGGEPG